MFYSAGPRCRGCLKLYITQAWLKLLNVWVLFISYPTHIGYFQLENVLVTKFLYWVDLFSIQFFFTKSIQITELKSLCNYPNWISISIHHCLHKIKSNIKQCKYLNFSISNHRTVSNTELTLQSIQHFLIIVKFGY